MEPTIHDIGRPTIRSSRPVPPQEEGTKKVRETEVAKDAGAADREGEEAPVRR